MTNLEEIKDRALEALGDPNGTRYSAAQLEEAIRLALEEYSRALPQVREAAITVTTAGSSQEISGVDRLLTVIEVVYPYDPAAANPEPCETWYAYSKDGSSWLLFEDRAPQVGELICVRCAAGHTLAGLDGAALTSLPNADEGLLVQAAAGHAAVMRSAGMVQAYGKRNPQDEIQQLGKLRLELFRKQLDARKDTGLSGLPARPWRVGWALDGWDGE